MRLSSLSRGRIVPQFLLSVLLFGLGCLPPPPAKTPFTYRPDLLPAAYFPLAENTVWSYRAKTPSGEGGELLVVVKVAAKNGRVAIISTEPNPLSYEDTGDTILRLPSGTPILKTPLTASATWDIPDGTAKILAVDGVAETPAGRFPDCLVVEEITHDRRLVTSYAPGVGQVKQEIYARDASGKGAPDQLETRILLGSFHAGGSSEP